MDESLISPATPLTSGSSVSSEEMAAISKEAGRDEPVQNAKPVVVSSQTTSDDSVFSLIYSIVKKVSIVGAIYLVGYMNWSVAWLITPVVLAVTREHWRKSSDLRREIAKASATANEKDVILARINDLPAWVSNSIYGSYKL